MESAIYSFKFWFVDVLRFRQFTSWTNQISSCQLVYRSTSWSWRWRILRVHRWFANVISNVISKSSWQIAYGFIRGYFRSTYPSSDDRSFIFFLCFLIFPRCVAVPTTKGFRNTEYTYQVTHAITNPAHVIWLWWSDEIHAISRYMVANLLHQPGIESSRPCGMRAF